MKTIHYVLIAGAILLASCGSTYNLTSSEESQHLKEIELDNFLVMVLHDEEAIEARVALEKSVVDELNTIGYQAVCGYRSVSDYENLENKISEITEAMGKAKAKNLIVIDPIRAIDHDPSGYYDEMDFYRAMDWRTSEFFSTVGELIESADASQFIIGVSIWNIELQEFVWKGTYEIKAPGAYDLQYAKEYAKEFTNVILRSINVEEDNSAKKS